MTIPYETPYEIQPGGPQSAGQRTASAARDVPRPATLVATVMLTALAAASGLTSAIITFSAGRSMLASSVGPVPRGTSADLVSGLIDAAYKTLQTRAILAVVVAVIMIALAAAVRGGRAGVRAGLSVVLFAAMGTWLLNIRDSGVPGAIRGLDDVALAFSLIAIVVAWLPANARYARDRKAAQRG